MIRIEFNGFVTGPQLRRQVALDFLRMAANGVSTPRIIWFEFDDFGQSPLRHQTLSFLTNAANVVSIQIIRRDSMALLQSAIVIKSRLAPFALPRLR